MWYHSWGQVSYEVVASSDGGMIKPPYCPKNQDRFRSSTRGSSPWRGRTGCKMCPGIAAGVEWILQDDRFRRLSARASLPPTKTQGNKSHGGSNG